MSKKTKYKSYYRGKGMCKVCIYSYTDSVTKWLYCRYYRNFCRCVARNCKEFIYETG